MSKDNTKEQKFDDNIAEIVLGGTLAGAFNFNNGSSLEKFFVLLGLVILIVGIIRTIIKYKGKNKKGMIVFLVLMGLLSTITFFGLIYNMLK